MPYMVDSNVPGPPTFSQLFSRLQKAVQHQGVIDVLTYSVLMSFFLSICLILENQFHPTDGREEEEAIKIKKNR